MGYDLLFLYHIFMIFLYKFVDNSPRSTFYCYYRKLYGNVLFRETQPPCYNDVKFPDSKCNCPLLCLSTRVTKCHCIVLGRIVGLGKTIHLSAFSIIIYVGDRISLGKNDIPSFLKYLILDSVSTLF